MNPHDVVIRPVMSEKAIMGIADNKYAFYVRPGANRTEIKDSIERVFDVDVVKINLVNVRGKIKSLGRHAGRRPGRLKAIVTLKAGQRIQALEGLT